VISYTQSRGNSTRAIGSSLILSESHCQPHAECESADSVYDQLGLRPLASQAAWLLIIMAKSK